MESAHGDGRRCRRNLVLHPVTTTTQWSGGHLGIGRGGFTLHFENSRLNGYDYIKKVAIDPDQHANIHRCAARYE